MERLEKFVIQNRTELDTAVPSLKVWAEIDKKLERKSAKRRSLWTFVKAAAAVIILLGAGSLIGVNLSENNSGTGLAEVAPQYADLEHYYNSQIDQKVKQLASYRHDVYVQEDLRQLDEVFTELRNELEFAPKGAEEKIIQLMIENYETKIEILERVLEKIQSVTPGEDTHEDNDLEPLKPESDEVSL